MANVPVQIFTFRRFRVVIDGVNLDLVGRPAALLQSIVARGGERVPRQAVTQDLVPGKAPAAAKGTIEIALHRLRRLLRYPGAIELCHGIVRLDRSLAWADAVEFEALLTLLDAEPVQRGFACAQISSLAGNVLRLYQGDFLESEPDRTWMIMSRNRFRTKFLRAIAGAGDALERSQHWDAAIELYETALERDAFAEKLYRRLMVCLRNGGYGTEAIRAYKRCEQNLRGIGSEPSSATLAVYHSLLRC